MIDPEKANAVSVLSGDHSKISLKTKNVFIECTATDVTKVRQHNFY